MLGEPRLSPFNRYPESLADKSFDNTGRKSQLPSDALPMLNSFEFFSKHPTDLVISRTRFS